MKKLKFFLSCVLGAGIVGSIGSMIVSVHFWWIGMSIGGFIGLLFYMFREIISPVGQAYYSPNYYSPNRLLQDKLRSFIKPNLWTHLLVWIGIVTLSLLPIVIIDRNLYILFAILFAIGGVILIVRFPWWRQLFLRG